MYNYFCNYCKVDSAGVWQTSFLIYACAIGTLHYFHLHSATPTYCIIDFIHGNVLLFNDSMIAYMNKITGKKSSQNC